MSELNDNQKIVLEWLKEVFILSGRQNILGCVYAVHHYSKTENAECEKGWKVYRELTTKQEAQVLKAFAEWGLEQWQTTDTGE